jgi:hypothetical protein
MSPTFSAKMGSDDPGIYPRRPKNEGSDNAKAPDEEDAEEDVEASDEEDAEEDAKEDAEEDAEEDVEAPDDDSKDNDLDDPSQSVGTDTSDNSRRKMARSKLPKPPPSERQVKAWVAEKQSKQDEAVKWYEDVLGFPEPCAKALYIEQTLTDVEILSNLSDKQIDAICSAIRKPGGDSKGTPTPILAVKRLKLAAFCIKLYERTSRNLPDWSEIAQCDLVEIQDQKKIEDDYLASKDPGPKLKPMSLDVHSAPTCFEKVQPLDFSEHYGDARNAETLRKVTNEIMEAIRELSGQEYVDIYASAAKEALKERE